MKGNVLVFFIKVGFLKREEFVLDIKEYTYKNYLDLKIIEQRKLFSTLFDVEFKIPEEKYPIHSKALNSIITKYL